MLAVVRLLAGVCTGVDGQRAPLDEALAAVWVVAFVRPLVRVYPIVALQVRLAVEALWLGGVSYLVIAAAAARGSQCTHLTTPIPVALKGASRGRFVVNNLHDFHIWGLLGSWFRR